MAPVAGRLLYGWHDVVHDCLRLSSDPPDAPVRRSHEFAQLSDAKVFADRKRAKIMWWPKLPDRYLSEAA